LDIILTSRPQPVAVVDLDRCSREIVIVADAVTTDFATEDA